MAEWKKDDIPQHPIFGKFKKTFYFVYFYLNVNFMYTKNTCLYLTFNLLKYSVEIIFFFT